MKYQNRQIQVRTSGINKQIWSKWSKHFLYNL